MQVITKPDNPDETMLVNDRGQFYQISSSYMSHAEQIKQRLRELGLSKFALMRSESKYLPKIIHENEYIGGIAYGHTEGGFAMLIATNSRIIFLDKKPGFVNQAEINYFVVNGVSFNNTAFGTEVILHTRIKDYIIHTFNPQCAKKFVDFIESRLVNNKANLDYYQNEFLNQYSSKKTKG